MPFGKHRGKNLNIVFKTDKRYIEWLVTTDWYNQRFSDYAKKSKELLNDYDRNIVLSDNINIYTDGSCAFNGMKGATCGIGIYFCETNRNKINNISELLLIDNPTNNYAELFAIDTISEYHVRYVRKPKPIILADFEEDDDISGMNLSIDGYNTRKDCELNTEVHRDILIRAVDLAVLTARENNLMTRVQVNKKIV